MHILCNLQVVLNFTQCRVYNMRMNESTTFDQLCWGHLTAFDPSDPRIGEICGKSGLISPSGRTMGPMIRVGEVKQPAGRPHQYDGSFAPRNFTPAFDANCNFMLLYLESTVEFQIWYKASCHRYHLPCSRCLWSLWYDQCCFGFASGVDLLFRSFSDSVPCTEWVSLSGCPILLLLTTQGVSRIKQPWSVRTARSKDIITECTLKWRLCVQGLCEKGKLIEIQSLDGWIMDRVVRYWTTTMPI